MKKPKAFKVLIIVFLLGSIFCGCTNNAAESNDTSTVNQEFDEGSKITPPLSIPSENAILPESLEYLGAFRLPEDGDDETEMFSWGGQAMAFNPKGNNGEGSLFLTGHDWHTFVSEISIPVLKQSKNAEDLNRAKIIQPLSDIKNGLFDKWTLEIPRVGLEVLNDELYFCWGEHFEEDTDKGTHGVTDLDLSKSNAKSVCTVGDFLYSTNDYMFSIPSKWAEENGFDLATGRYRDGGWSGMGPALFAISSESIKSAGRNEKIEAAPLILYDNSYQGDSGQKMNSYSHADSWAGGAWITADDKEAVVFVGTHGYGNTWYGFSNGVVWPIAGDEDVEYPEVPEWPHDSRGWWNDDFRACIVLYDSSHFLSTTPDEVQPYAFIDLSEYMIAIREETQMQYIGGAAYDDKNNLMYVQEIFADGDYAVVHVFSFS